MNTTLQLLTSLIFDFAIWRTEPQARECSAAPDVISHVTIRLGIDDFLCIINRNKTVSLSYDFICNNWVT